MANRDHLSTTSATTSAAAAAVIQKVQNIYLKIIQPSFDF